MHIQVDHHQALHRSVLQQHPGGHGTVVEDAEAAAIVRERVMRASRQMAGQAMLKRQASRQHRPAHRQPAAPHQRRGGRQPDASLRRPAQFTACESLVIGACMHQFQPAPWRRQRLLELIGFGQPLMQQQGMQQLELAHRKAMAAGQRRRVGRVVDERWPQDSAITSPEAFCG